MIRAEQIPDTCEWTAVAAFCVEGATWKDVIAAAINAWPGMEVFSIMSDGEENIVLPLTQENTNEKV